MNNDSVTSALIVIDMQRAVMATCPAADAVFATVNELIADARRSAAPLVFVRHQDEDLAPGSEAWQLDGRLDHRDGNPVVEKTFRDAFAETDFDKVLRRAGARRLVVTGAHSDYCVQTTALSALAHGYDIALVADGHAAEPAVISGRQLDAATVSGFVNSRMATLRYPDRLVEVLPARDVSFGRVTLSRD